MVKRILSQNPKAIAQRKYRAKQKAQLDQIEKNENNLVKTLKNADKPQKRQINPKDNIFDDNWGREPYLEKEPKPQFEDSEVESFDPFYNNMWGQGVNPDAKNKRSHQSVLRSEFPEFSE